MNAIDRIDDLIHSTDREPIRYLESNADDSRPSGAGCAS